MGAKFNKNNDIDMLFASLFSKSQLMEIKQKAAAAGNRPPIQTLIDDDKAVDEYLDSLNKKSPCVD